MAKYLQFDCYLGSGFVLEFPKGFNSENTDDYRTLRQDFRNRLRQALDDDEFDVDWDFYQEVEH